MYELREANARLVVAGVRMQELAEEAQRARGAAEAANMEKDQFLAALSHELRTPLSAILGWTHLLRHGSLSGAQVNHALDVIERNAKLQSQLITDLLNIAEIIAGKLRLDRSLVDLGPTIEASVDSLRTVANEKAVALEVDTAPGVQPVLADPSRVEQIVWNIVSNAIKFTPRGGRIQVQLRQSGSTAVITIKDSGIGIEPALLPHIFDRFFQADRRTERAFGGLGLGLAIAKQLVELHGGRVTAHSAGTGCGATFVVTFPTRERASNPADGPQDVPTVSLEGIRVLLVEDEPDASDLMVALLNRNGANVTAAGSAQEALMHWGSGRWDLLIADIGMPGRNGYDLIRQIRTREDSSQPPVPAIALTAYAQAKDREKALAAGFNLHVTKPFDSDVLVATVAELVRGRPGS